MRKTTGNKLSLVAHCKCGSRFLEAFFQANDIPIYNWSNFEQAPKTDIAYIDHPWAIPFNDLDILSTITSHAIALYRHPVDLAISMYLYRSRGRRPGTIKNAGINKEIPFQIEPIYHSINKGSILEVAKEQFDYEKNINEINGRFNNCRHVQYEYFKQKQDDFLNDIAQWAFGKKLKHIPSPKNISYTPKSYWAQVFINWIIHKISGIDSLTILQAYTEGKMNKGLFKVLYKMNHKQGEHITHEQYQNLCEHPFYSRQIKIWEQVGNESRY